MPMRFPPGKGLATEDKKVISWIINHAMVRAYPSTNPVGIRGSQIRVAC